MGTGASILRRIVATARTGHPFVAANVRRLRVLAAVSLVYFVTTVVRSLVAQAIQNELGLGEVTPSYSFAPIVSAVAILALAQLWQHAVELRLDSSAPDMT